LGARVFLAGRTLESFEEVAEGIRSAGGVAETAQVDAIDEMAVDQHADTVAASAGGSMSPSTILSLDGYYEGPGKNVMALFDYRRELYPMDESFDA
jgi:3-oxoacyl-[acyl-carrier protein] reductase